ncbi:zinc finger and BTB domain-containing protein 11 [Ambystoma mexicanum]|uniref:zinc finger and BTB domain-containing protein 11 n=1 Tax=Ambystoma mexicanum TaxID=8296 RepID=UPI0037E8AA6F
MSSEESYLAILRYLTDQRQPYAPGTPSNAKRKIRKAAACYVARGGTLYYQRRQRGRQRFCELEVVLPPARRNELIRASHQPLPGAPHRTRLQTWQQLSQRYWWRGVLKEVKDYIKGCDECQERNDRSRTLSDPTSVLEELGLEVQACEDSNDTDDESITPPPDLPQASKNTKRRLVAKHELVFVDSKGSVKQVSLKHSQEVLCQLNQQRLANQFCDVTLLIEGEEYKAHKSVLAASSEYFRELFIEKGALSSHEAVVDLSGFCRSSFLPLLEFAYTSVLTFDFCSMAEVAMLARHLFMSEVLEICEHVHKQMESKQLTVYQKGDVQTVECSKSLLDENVNVSPGLHSNVIHPVNVVYTADSNLQVEGNVLSTQTVSEQNMTRPTKSNVSTLTPDLQQAVSSPTEIVCSLHPDVLPCVTTSVEGCISSEQTDVRSVVPESTNIIISHVITELQPITNSPAEIEAYVVHSDVASSEAISTDLSMSEEHTGIPECVHGHLDLMVPNVNSVKETSFANAADFPGSSDMDTTNSPEILHTLPNVSNEVLGVQGSARQKCGRLSEDLSMVDPIDTADSPPEIAGETVHDVYKNRLRQRSVGEGGYIHLHQGLEKKLPNRKINPKSAVQQVAMKLVQRGRKLKMPKRERIEVQGDHRCSECGLVFQRRYALIMHALKHEQTRDFKCSLCKKEFQYSASLRAHLIRHTQRSEEPASPPPIPDEPSTDPKKSRTKRKFICDICGRTLPKLYSLRIHMLKHTGVKPHACKACGKTFTYKHGLKMHRILHEINKQFKCELCDKSFVTKRSLNEHTSLHTGESKYLCSICGKSFHRASGLSKHAKKHQPKPETRRFQCTQCDKTFFEARDLRQHMNKHLGVRPFQCQFCGKCYSWKKDWYSHVKSHSVTDPYTCNVCGKQFFEKALFRRHVKKATHGKKGRAKQNLQRVCEHCGRKFTQLREYRRHMNNHEGVKPFECLTCGVAWADARSLKRHVRTHTGERPYVCPVCNDAYIDARTLRKHMTKYHGDYVPCKIMLEKDTLQFHNQGTQVEHAVSILSADMQEQESEMVAEDIETVLVTGGETLEAIEAVAAEAEECTAVSTLSDQSIMQVVNYVLAQQQGQRVEVSETIETVEADAVQVSDTERRVEPNVEQ